MIKKNGFIYDKLDCLLFAIAINMHVVRYFFGMYDSNILNVIVFGLILLIGFIKMFFMPIKIKIISLKFISIITFVGYSLISALFNGLDSIALSIKLVISFLIALFAYNFKIEKINRCISFCVFINIIYALFIYVHPDYTINYLTNKSVSYLGLTISLALVVNIYCSKILVLINHSKSKIILLRNFLGLIILTPAVLLFQGRGNIIFTFIIIISIFLLISLYNYKYFIKYIPILLFFVSFAFFVYFMFASNTLQRRMERLFNNTSSESRIEIYKDSIGFILNNDRFIIGGGTNSFIKELKFYPHNIYLHVIGEYGITGILLLLIFTISVFNSIITKAYYVFCLNKNNLSIKLIFISVVTSFLFYFLNFNKSFSFYDSYPLMIFIAFVFSFNNPVNKKTLLKLE